MKAPDRAEMDRSEEDVGYVTVRFRPAGECAVDAHPACSKSKLIESRRCTRHSGFATLLPTLEEMCESCCEG